MTRDSGSRRDGEDKRSLAEGEARQSAAAKTADRPDSMVNQHMSARELLASELAATGYFQDVVMRLRAAEYRPECDRDFVTAALRAIERAQSRTPSPSVSEVKLLPADDWQAQGYATPEAEIDDMANIGRALVESIALCTREGPLKGWMPADCPSEIVVDLLNMLHDARPSVSEDDAAPIQMLLYCPECGVKHVDAPNERTPDWTNPPHKSHLCHGCGCIWRPADVPTEGCETISTIGKADTIDLNKVASLSTRPTGDVREALATIREGAEELNRYDGEVANITADMLSALGTVDKFFAVPTQGRRRG